MGTIRIAIVGIGNCASSLVQGLDYYGEGSNDHVGLMHYEVGGYRPGDIKVVAAWDVDARKVGRDVAEAAIRISRTGRVPVSLCDYTGAAIQSQAVIAALTTMMQNPVVRSRRVAMYTGGVMAKMQAVRATRDRSEFRFFTDKDEARAWLFAAEDAAAAA